MIIKQLNRINGKNVNLEGLFFYLSQIVLSKTDEEIEKRTKLIETKKSFLENAKNTINPIKLQIEKSNQEYSKELQLERVLSLVDILIKENAVVGKNRLTILDLMHKVGEMDYHKLRRVEEKLSLYLPNKYLK